MQVYGSSFAGSRLYIQLRMKPLRPLLHDTQTDMGFILQCGCIGIESDTIIMDRQ